MAAAVRASLVTSLVLSFFLNIVAIIAPYWWGIAHGAVSVANGLWKTCVTSSFRTACVSLPFTSAHVIGARYMMIISSVFVGAAMLATMFYSLHEKFRNKPVLICTGVATGVSALLSLTTVSYYGYKIPGGFSLLSWAYYLAVAHTFLSGIGFALVIVLLLTEHVRIRATMALW